MSERYDIFYAGKIVDGFDEATVRDNVARLFKADDATLQKLFSGKPQLIKRGVEKAAAIKYKSAMQKAGAVPLIRAHAAAKAESQPAPQPAAPEPAAPEPAAPEPAAPEAKKQSMAERLAALTGEEAPRADQAAAPPAPSQPASFGTDAGASGDESGISLAPPGSDVLSEAERKKIEAVDVDTSAINLVPEFAAPEPEPREEPPAPDTSHMSMGEVGEDIPHLETALVELDPDTSHLSMGEVGEDIPHLDVEQEPVNVDTSAIDLAPEGSDVLEEQYRKKDEAAAPDTSHIKLANAFDAPA
ncbi:MAG: hypothetical protein V2I66_00290 [Halieaceae bacterium]|jgi:hypothetical protein|nr:hypothetical protein [Halieaceae bacterium]